MGDIREISAPREQINAIVEEALEPGVNANARISLLVAVGFELLLDIRDQLLLLNTTLGAYTPPSAIELPTKGFNLK